MSQKVIVNMNEATESELCEMDDVIGRLVFLEREKNLFADWTNLKARIRGEFERKLAAFENLVDKEDPVLELPPKSNVKPKKEVSRKSRPIKNGSIISLRHPKDPKSKVEDNRTFAELADEMVKKRMKRLHKEYPDGIPEYLLRNLEPLAGATTDHPANFNTSIK